MLEKWERLPYMPKPFLFYEAFSINRELKPKVEHVPGVGKIVIIDDFYKNPNIIIDLIDKAPAPPFKISNGSRNFKDYFDCRLVMPLHHILYDKRDIIGQVLLWKIIKSKLGFSVIPKRCHYEFNLFQWINMPSQDYQLYPHVDGSKYIAATIYLNPEEEASGGTAFYRDDPACLPDKIGYHEHNDIKVDVKTYCDLAYVVPARFNRCVIYPGWLSHGAHIDRHDFYVGDRWRINQVYFFEIER